MYYEVARKLVVSASGTAYLQAVSMEGANAIVAEFTSFGSVAGSIVAEVGNDLENWGTAGTQAAVGAATYGTFQASNIAARYLRLRFIAGAGGALIIGAGVNTAQL